MISKKRISKKNQLGRVLSEPELRKNSKTPKAAPEDADNPASKSPRGKTMLNLQIPASKPRKSTMTQRGSKHGEDREVEQIAREKNSLLAQVTALQREIHKVKNQNKQLRENLKSKAIESEPKEELQNDTHWPTLEESMQEFKQVFYSYMRRT